MRSPPPLSARQRQPEPALTLPLLMSGNHPAAFTNRCRDAGTHMKEARPAERRGESGGSAGEMFTWSSLKRETRNIFSCREGEAEPTFNVAVRCTPATNSAP